MRLKTFQSPLSIYVIWNAPYEDGEKYAENIYSSFCRKVKEPFERGIGIPVYFRSVFNEKGQMAGILVEESERNAVVLLCEGSMYDTEAWQQPIKQLLAHQAEGHLKIFPVSLDEDGFDIHEDLSRRLFIKLHNIEGEKEYERRWKILEAELMHEIARMLFDMPSSVQDSGNQPPPVKLFLSHAHLDGQTLAEKLRLHVLTKTKLKTFLDTKDIGYGENIRDEIERFLTGNTAVIAFQTDEYATRDWCLAEIILAKRMNASILTVQYVQKGEPRSFPYLGNGPTLRWTENCDEIIDRVLVQVVGRRFAYLKIEKEVEASGTKSRYQCHILGQPPELLDFVRFKDVANEEGKPQLVIYPEPPMGFEESRLLNDLHPDVTFTTPMSIPALSHLPNTNS